MKSLLKTITLAVFLLTLISTTNGIIKQLLGAAMMGDLFTGLYSVKCLSSVNNFTNFLLYTRNHPDDPVVLQPNDWRALQKSDFDPAIPTKIIVHGFVDNMRLSDWMIRMKNALLREGDYNVIIVEWSCGNGFPYSKAVSNSKKTAKELGNLLIFLQETRGIDHRDVHIIGHSLGSQIGGIVGHRLGAIGRISGLDPAGPKFYNVPLEEMLDPSDAAFVDVIHTDSGNGILEGLGLDRQVGHVDFYPNGGKSQPGCHSSPFAVLPQIGVQRAARYYLTCDHYRAIEYYIESIDALKKLDLNCEFIGVGCRDWTAFSEGQCADCSIPGNCAVMGYHSYVYPFRNAHSAKEFYIKTSRNDPYCVHQYQVIIETANFVARPKETILEFEGSLTSGVVYLEMSTESGKTTKFNLEEHGVDTLQPNKRYVKLVTSKFPLGVISVANLWWGNSERPNAISSPLEKSALMIKKIEIYPLVVELQSTVVPSEKRSRSSNQQKLVLCVEDEAVVPNRLHRLSLNSC